MTRQIYLYVHKLDYYILFYILYYIILYYIILYYIYINLIPKAADKRKERKFFSIEN